MKLSSISPNDKTAVSNPPIVSVAIFDSATAYFVLSLTLSIFAIAPLFYPGYMQTHTGFAPLWNVADLRANLGNWRWLPHIATSFDPLRSDGLGLYYLAAILPLDPEAAIKGVVGLGWLLGNAGMFLWLKHWLGRPGALVAALVYTYLPHQIATVYVRGAWGEAFFWGMLPWAIFVAVEVERRRGEEQRSRGAGEGNQRLSLVLLLLTALIWFILGLSQLGLMLWAFIFVTLFLVMIYSRRAIQTILMAGFGGAVLAILTTLAISAAATTPSLSAANFFDHFLYPFQLFSAYWGFGSSRPGWNDSMSFQLGLAAVGLALLSLILWQQRLRTHRTDRRLIFFSCAGLIFILLQFGWSEPLWHLPSLFGYTLAGTLTYPWQLLGLTGLCLAVLAGASLWLDEQLTRLPLFSSIIILVILSSYRYLSPQLIQIEPEMQHGPEVLLGANQLALLSHSFSAEISGNTAGLELEPTTIPLTAHGPLYADEVLRLNVTWQPLQIFPEDWKVFVHLVDANGHVLAQFDGQPLVGTYPTSRWIPGERIEDSYALRFPSPVPPGPYQIFLGLYNETSGARLPVPSDNEGRVTLDVE